MWVFIDLPSFYLSIGLMIIFLLMWFYKVYKDFKDYESSRKGPRCPECGKLKVQNGR